jgi:hypothetical protein
MIKCGPIPESPGDTWKDIELALRIGARGFRRGRSLPQLLAKHRGLRNLSGTPPFTEALILKWAGRCFRHTGPWPRLNSGSVPGRPGETWAAVDAALRDGPAASPVGTRWRNCCTISAASETSHDCLASPRRRSSPEPTTTCVAQAVIQRRNRDQFLERPEKRGKRFISRWRKDCGGLPRRSSLARLLAGR